MSSTDSTPRVPDTRRGSAAGREVRLTAALVSGALLLGALLQVWVPPGPLTLVAASGIAGVVLAVLALVVPGRLRSTIAGFRFTSTLLVALAIFAVLGTLILQGKPAAFYEQRYGAVAPIIQGLRLDDLFHGLPFAGLMALFVAAVIASATLRWPVRARNAGFFVCHVGLLTSMLGAAASSALSIRGRVDLHTGGETATQVVVTRAGLATGEVAPLGFDLRLDRFDLVNYETEYRVGYYEQVRVEDERGIHREWKLRASFDPDRARHRLPGGDSFELAAVWPDPRDPTSRRWRNPAVQLVARRDGQPLEKVLRAEPPEALFLDDRRALVFEKRDEEVKAFLSSITATRGADELKAVVAVNQPIDFGGWTLYQVNYDPKDPGYSGLEAVHDPGVTWVFTGFALISLGVFFMFYVEPRLKARGKPVPAAAPARAA